MEELFILGQRYQCFSIHMYGEDIWNSEVFYRLKHVVMVLFIWWMKEANIQNMERQWSFYQSFPIFLIHGI